jgi:3-hydroxyacyl-[acyl-carrier-protein] dehydratase
MLNKDLYHIGSIHLEEQELIAQIELNTKHPIFKGHFPDVPVLPGVTMMQMVKEILEEALGKPLLIKKAGQLKFLQMINPEKTAQLSFHIKYNETEEGLKVNALLAHQEVVFFKMTALLV